MYCRFRQSVNVGLSNIENVEDVLSALDNHGVFLGP
jgi:hypothetical protein